MRPASLYNHPIYEVQLLKICYPERDEHGLPRRREFVHDDLKDHRRDLRELTEDVKELISEVQTVRDWNFPNLPLQDRIMGASQAQKKIDEKRSVGNEMLDLFARSSSMKAALTALRRLSIQYWNVAIPDQPNASLTTTCANALTENEPKHLLLFTCAASATQFISSVGFVNRATPKDAHVRDDQKLMVTLRNEECGHESSLDRLDPQKESQWICTSASPSVMLSKLNSEWSELANGEVAIVNREKLEWLGIFTHSIGNSSQSLSPATPKSKKKSKREGSRGPYLTYAWIPEACIERRMTAQLFLAISAQHGINEFSEKRSAAIYLTKQNADTEGDYDTVSSPSSGVDDLQQTPAATSGSSTPSYL